MIIFVDNINFKNENNFRSLFYFLRINHIKFSKNTFGDKGLKLAQGNYQNLKRYLPSIRYSKKELRQIYWHTLKGELLHHLLKNQELYNSDIENIDDQMFSLIYDNYYDDLILNARAVDFWLDYWNKYLNNNIYICFSNTLIYTRTLSDLLQKKQIPLLVVEHFATGNDYYLEQKYSHIPNNIKIPIEGPTQAELRLALTSIKNWNNKNVKIYNSPRKSFFNSQNTFLLITQVVNDFSIIYTNRKYLSVITYYKKVIDKVLSETNSNLIIKTHPYEKQKNKEPITYNVLQDYIYTNHRNNLKRIQILEDYDINTLIDNISCSILFNSQAAFEVAGRGKPVITLGNPFYRNHFTIDSDIDNIIFKDANKYKYNGSQGYKFYLSNLIKYTINNSDIEKISRRFRLFRLDTREFTNTKQLRSRRNSKLMASRHTSNITRRKIRKLIKKPKQFFIDSERPIFKQIGSII